MATAARSRSRTPRDIAPKPRNDAYTGLLFIAFVALITSSILLFLDYNQYGGKSPPKLSIPQLGQSPAAPVPGAPPPDAPAPMDPMAAPAPGPMGAPAPGPMGAPAPGPMGPMPKGPPG